MSGRVIHFEIPFDDGERARLFYERAFGWRTTPIPGLDYTLAITGPSGDAGPTEEGFINGGLLRRAEPYTAPTLAIDVESIDDTLAAVEEGGGTTLVPRSAVGDMGFAAYFRDTEGNVVGLWEDAVPA
jgi:predicted enzyme related to lactoylglutathione lyase